MRYNKRIIGYDNAHGVKPKRKQHGAQRTVWDHKHNKNIVAEYEFQTTEQLLEDFWKDVNAIVDK